MSETLFDRETDDLTHEFWGDSPGWVDGRRPASDRTGRTGRMGALQLQPSDADTGHFSLDHTPTSMRAIRDGIAAFRPKRRRDDATGPIERTREHRAIGAEPAPVEPAVARAPITRRPSPASLPHRDASIGELAAGAFDRLAHREPAPMFDDADDIELDGLADTRPVSAIGWSGGRRSLDPLVVRLLIVVLVVLVAIPLALSMRDDAPDTVGTAPAALVPPVELDTALPESPQPATTAADVQAAPAPAPVAAPVDTVTTIETLAESTSEAAAPAAAAASPTEAPLAEVTEQVSQPTVAAPTVGSEAAVVEAQAERQVPDCSLTYTAGPGDSWYRIAGEAGVTPEKLLYQNSATTATVILPGDEICLPPGSTVPTAPTTTVAPTTTAPTTTAAPTTTVAPTTPATTDEVQAMIREIWPDELEEKALQIAWRESGYQATADNGWCCVGVFQIYWSVHYTWLSDYGIHTRDDLKDARKNITAAYGLYQRAGGWGPWSQTAS